MALEHLSVLCTFDNSIKCNEISFDRFRFFFRIVKRAILVKGTGESAAHSDNLGNSRNRGASAFVINVWHAFRSHLPPNSSYFESICTFQELHNTCS